MTSGLLFHTFIYLAGVAIAAPIAKRFGLSSVIGYLITGIIIGPFALALVGGNSADVMQLAQFGIIMMLFIIGLELQPSILWQLRIQIFILGLFQVSLTAISIVAIARLFNLSFQDGFVVGLILALSSTAIVLQLFTEKKLLHTSMGKTAFSVLLFQDISVIPIIAFFQFLIKSHADDAAATVSDWHKAVYILLVVSGIIILGRYVIKPIFRFIAKSNMRESFTAVALLLIVGTTLLMEALGLSPALGAFLAGVVLAENEYRHELESNIEPFRGVLLGLFFITIGASMNFAFILTHIGLILLCLALLFIVKFCVLFFLGKLFRLSLAANFLFSLALMQGGEFCFVLLTFTLTSGLLAAATVNTLVAVVALSMFISPFFVTIYEYFSQKTFNRNEGSKPHDLIESDKGHVVIAGYGRFGQIVGRLLIANRFKVTILDLDADHVELIRSFGYKIYYGDASRLDLLENANIAEAKLFVLAIDDHEKSLTIAQMVRDAYPDLKMLIRVRGRTQAYEFLKLGFKHIYRETFDTSLQMGIAALRMLGFRAHQAVRAAHVFKHSDEETMERLAHYTDDMETYRNEIIKSRIALEEVFAADLAHNFVPVDTAWSDENSKERG